MHQNVRKFWVITKPYFYFQMTFAKTNVFSYATDGSSSNVTTGVTITDLEDNFGRTVEVEDAKEDPFINDIEQTGGM